MHTINTAFTNVTTPSRTDLIIASRLIIRARHFALYHTHEPYLPTSKSFAAIRRRTTTARPNNKTTKPSMPTLLDLPPELRTAIHALALIHDSPLSIAGIYPDYHGPGATTPLTRTHLALTQVNAQLRAETLPIFYSANTFAICLQPVYVTYTRPHPKKQGQLQDIYKRSYGDWMSAEWVKGLEEEAAVRSIKTLRVYVACVTRWEGDEVGFERDKCRAYGVVEVPGAGAGAKAMTAHVLFDMCSGSRVFYEVDLEGGGGWRGLLRLMRRVVLLLMRMVWRRRRRCGAGMSVRFAWRR